MRTDAARSARGQALVELALGMFAAALTVSALAGLGVYMVRSLKAQNAARSGSPEPDGKVEVNVYLGAGTVERLTVRERLDMPDTLL